MRQAKEGVITSVKKNMYRYYLYWIFTLQALTAERRRRATIAESINTMT